MMTNANDHTNDQELQPDAQQVEELACALDGCAATYRLLARTYRHELDQDAIDEIRAMRFPAYTGSDYMDQGYRGIASYLSKVGAAAVGELEVDYSRTFIGGGIDSYSAAYPYESVHVGRKRLMMQAARDEVLAIYSAYGLAKSGAMKEGEDHIAYELEFLQVLCERSAETLRAGDEEAAESLLAAQRNFLDDHVLTWVGKLTAQMRHFSKTEFYHGVSYLTIGAVKEHAALLAEVLE